MATRAADRVTLATLPAPTAVRFYYLLQDSTLTPPAKPTTHPPAAPWTTTEPGYTAGSTSTLYTVMVTMYGTAWEYGPVQKSSAYEAAKQAANTAQNAITVANLASAAAAGMVKAQQTDPGHQAGRIWLQLDANGRTIGIKISNGSTWSSYALMADQVLVPGSVGAVQIADGAITTPKMQAGSIDVSVLDAETFNGYEINGVTVNGGHFYSPNSTTLPRVHVGDSTIEVIRGEEGQEFRTVSIGGTVADELRLYDLNNKQIFGVTQQGDGSIRGDMAVGGRVTSEGRDILSAIDAQPKGLIGAWYGPGASSWPPIGFAPLGIGQVPIEAERYRRYSADFVGRFTPQQAGDVLELALRVRVGSSDGYVTDDAIWSNLVALNAGANLVTIPPVQYYAQATTWTTFTITARNATTSSRSITLSPGSARIHVSDEGPGALHWGRASTAGGTPFSGVQTEETPTATTYTRRYPAVALRSWRGGSQVTDALHHGYWGGLQRYSWIGFDHAKIAADLAGASNISAKLTMRNTHTWNGRSTSVRIGYSAQTTAPASPLTSGSNAATVTWKDGALSTVSIPWSASARSVVLGDGAGTSNAFYNKFSYSLSDIALELTFTKTGAA